MKTAGRVERVREFAAHHHVATDERSAHDKTGSLIASLERRGVPHVQETGALLAVALDQLDVIVFVKEKKFLLRRQTWRSDFYRLVVQNFLGPDEIVCQLDSDWS